MSTAADTVELHQLPPEEQERPADQRGATGPPDGPPASDRRGYRAAVRAFRSRRRLAAGLVALLLAIVAILVAMEVISHLAGQPLGVLPADRLTQLGQDTTWDSALARTAAVVAILLGLLLLALAILPGRARVVPVAAGRPEVILALRPAALAREAAAAAEVVPGIDHAAATASRSRLRVRVETPLRDPADLADQVRQAVLDRLAELAPLRQPRLQIALRYRED